MVFRVFVDDKARQQRGSGHVLNALVFGCHVGGGRRLFWRKDEDRGVGRRYAVTSPRPFRVANARWLLCGRLDPCAVAVEQLVAAAMNTRKALAAAMAAGRWSFSVTVQWVVERRVCGRRRGERVRRGRTCWRSSRAAWP